MNDLELPPKSRFFVANSFDKPDAKFITELAPDGFLYYIHPELREKWKNQGLTLHSEATPLEDFGMEVTIKDGVFYCHFENESKAKYPDGKPRFWQGETPIAFRYPGPPGTPMNNPFNVLDHIPTPRQIGAAEYEAIYELLDTQECHADPELAMAVCEEFKLHAQSIIDKLEAALLERSALGH